MQICVWKRNKESGSGQHMNHSMICISTWYTVSVSGLSTLSFLHSVLSHWCRRADLLLAAGFQQVQGWKSTVQMQMHSRSHTCFLCCCLMFVESATGVLSRADWYSFFCLRPASCTDYWYGRCAYFELEWRYTFYGLGCVPIELISWLISFKKIT